MQIYDPDLITPLVKTISALFEGSPDGVAIIAATVRNPMTIKMFETSCGQSLQREICPYELIQLIDAHGMFVHDLNLVSMSLGQPTFWDSALDRGSEVRIMRITTDDEAVKRQSE